MAVDSVKPSCATAYPSAHYCFELLELLFGFPLLAVQPTKLRHRLITILIIKKKIPNYIVHPESESTRKFNNYSGLFTSKTVIHKTNNAYNNTNFLQNIIVILSAFHPNSTPLI
jgi:hypothetical protein